MPCGLFVLPLPGNLLQPRACMGITRAVPGCAHSDRAGIQVVSTLCKDPGSGGENHTQLSSLGFVFPQAATMGIQVTNHMGLFGSNLKLSYW